MSARYAGLKFVDNCTLQSTNSFCVCHFILKWGCLSQVLCHRSYQTTFCSIRLRVIFCPTYGLSDQEWCLRVGLILQTAVEVFTWGSRQKISSITTESRPTWPTIMFQVSNFSFWFVFLNNEWVCMLLLQFLSTSVFATYKHRPIVVNVNNGNDITATEYKHYYRLY